MIRRYRSLLSTVVLAFALTACSAESSDAPAGLLRIAEEDPAAADIESRSQPAATTRTYRERPSSSDPEPAIARTVVIPIGTSIDVVLVDSIGTERSKAGDVFLAGLASPIIVNGAVVVEKGAQIHGMVVNAESSGRVSGRAHIEIVLTELLTDGQAIAIQTAPFVQEAESDVGRDAKIGAAGAAVGALIGGLTGGKKGAVVGGAAGGAGAVMATKGRQLSYPSESRLSFVLSHDIEIENPTTS